MLLRSDGNAIAFGGNIADQCNIPALEPGMSYLQVRLVFLVVPKLLKFRTTSTKFDPTRPGIDQS